MKNIYLLPTDKPSKLFKDNFGYYRSFEYLKRENFSNQNIYITNDEEIKEGDWGLSKLNEVILFGRSYNEKFYKKIILTTDQDLIAEGVQDIDDEFLEWFVNNPSCENVKVNDITTIPALQLGSPNGHLMYKIIIPQEEPKQETLREADDNWVEKPIIGTKRESFIAGAKWMQEQMEKLKDFETWKEWKNNTK
jgi:hypothetical protein